MVIDGTAKRLIKEKDERDWPNVIIQSDKVIKKINSIWDELNIGEFVDSPSLKYSSLVINEGVVAGKR